MLTTAVCSSQVAIESRLHGLTSGRVFDTKPVKTVAWAIAKVQYGESIAAARALVAANLSLPTAWASGAQVQRVGEGGQGGYFGWRPQAISPKSRRALRLAKMPAPVVASARVGARRGSSVKIYRQRPAWPAHLGFGDRCLLPLDVVLETSFRPARATRSSAGYM